MTATPNRRGDAKAYTAKLLEQGNSEADVVRMLTNKGLRFEVAQALVEDVRQARMPKTPVIQPVEVQKVSLDDQYNMKSANTYAAELIWNGKHMEQVEQALIEKGYAPETAHLVIMNMQQQRQKSKEQKVKRDAVARQIRHIEKRNDGVRNMVIGGLVFLGGLLITGATMYVARNGGFYIVATGFILSGITQFLIGFSQTFNRDN